MADRATGELHQCKHTWAGIDAAMLHQSGGGPGRAQVRWSGALRLLQMLRLGPVLQSELREFPDPRTVISNLRRTVLAESSLICAGRWCCPVSSKYPHGVERVYQLEKRVPVPG